LLLTIANTLIEAFNEHHQIILRQYCTSAEQEVPRASSLVRGTFPGRPHETPCARPGLVYTADVTFPAGAHQTDVETHIHPI
jgi:hypothetical protein